MIEHEAFRAMHLEKTIGEQRVLDDVSFFVKRGEKVAVIGLQNTGKTLLADIIGGAARADGGTMLVEGAELKAASIAQAQLAGVFSVSWKPQIVPEMSVAMNMFLLNVQNAGRQFFSPHRIIAEAAAILEHYHIDINPHGRAEHLTPVEIRLLELVRIAAQKPKLVILSDVPISDDNIKDDRIVRMIERICREGAAFLFMGNKISKATMMCSRVYLMKDGILTSGTDTSLLDENLLLRLLKDEGRERKARSASGGASLSGDGERLLRITQREAGGEREVMCLHAGEILGLIQDMMPYADADYILEFLIGGKSGRTVYRNEKKTNWKSLYSILRAGVAIVPDFRVTGGVFSNLTCTGNLSIVSLRKLSGPMGWINMRKCLYTARQTAAMLDMGIEDMEGDMDSEGVSGEMRQKTQIGRWLWMQPEVFIFINPFSSVDEKSYEEIKRIMNMLAKKGMGVLILSSDYYKMHDACTTVVDGAR